MIRQEFFLDLFKSLIYDSHIKGNTLMNRLSTERRTQGVSALVEGMSINSDFLGYPFLRKDAADRSARTVLAHHPGGLQFTPNRKDIEMKHTPIVVYRNSVNGRIVTENYADRHPRTTEREIVYRPSPKKG
jgi:hypothetical protein